MKMHFALTVFSQFTKLLGGVEPPQNLLEWVGRGGGGVQNVTINKRFPREFRFKCFSNLAKNYKNFKLKFNCFSISHCWEYPHRNSKPPVT